MSCRWFNAFGLSIVCISFPVFGSGGGRSSVEAWYTTVLEIEEALSGATEAHVHLFVSDEVKSFEIVDRGILDGVLSSFGSLGWFGHVYFEYHAHVRLRFKLAAGLGERWTRDGRRRVRRNARLVWCSLLLSISFGADTSKGKVELYADNLKSVSSNSEVR